MTQKPRPYNSQVAPNQRPFSSKGKTASTHSKVPLSEATAGKLYRVRDKDWAALWGEHLSWDEANRLKNQVVGERRSTTARVEDMEVPPPEWWTCEHRDQDQPVDDGTDQLTSQASPPDQGHPHVVHGRVVGVIPGPSSGTAYGLDGTEIVTIPANGTIVSIPPGTELVFHSQVDEGGTGVREIPCAVFKGDVVQARPVAGHVAAVRHVAPRPAQPKGPPKYRDVTVKKPPPRTAPPPRDKTVSTAPVFVRLGAAPAPLEPNKEDVLPSPLKVALETDGPALPDNAITDADIKDVASDIGGAPTGDDIRAAKAQRDAERAG